MKKSGICAFVISLILTILSYEADALKCWVCSTDAAGGEFCADTFRADKIVDRQKLYGYVDCGSSNTEGMRPVCKKLKEKIKGQQVIKRLCYFEDEKDSRNQCLEETKESAPKDVEVQFCETCHEDGCNGSQQFGPVVTVSLIPVLIAKLLAW